jgi:hypothetical protein
VNGDNPNTTASSALANALVVLFAFGLVGDTLAIRPKRAR